MIPYITNRGGPMVGLEALHLQGLPIDELLLTRETEDQLSDLAGNAMSTTVVGTSVLVALVLSMKYLTPGNDKTTYEEKHGTRFTKVDDDVMEVDLPSDSVYDHIFGEDQLLERPFDLSKTTEKPLPSLLGDAMKSVRFCTCEGRKDMTEREVRRCDDCGFTACVKCGGRPEHNNRPVDVKAQPRLSPSTFERSLKSALPMCLGLAGLTEQLLDSLKKEFGAAIPSKRWDIWRNAVIKAVGPELRFVELKRQELWYATYESTKARAELCLHPQRPEWQAVTQRTRQCRNSQIAHESCRSSCLRRLSSERSVGSSIAADDFGGNIYHGRWGFGAFLAIKARSARSEIRRSYRFLPA
jgi:hypothetical protein